MTQNIRIVAPGPNGTIKDEYGQTLRPPVGWVFLPAGDAGVTRKVTAKGKYWRVQEKRGRKTFTKGVWAPANTIEEAKQQTELQRSSESHQKQLAQARLRREKQQTAYEQEFLLAVRGFLKFHENHQAIEQELALRVTQHAIPVGSGTVARTTMIPISERASKAVIAWMRHQTTAYDNLKIPNIKGERRKIRRMLAEASITLLDQYRSGAPISPSCPILKALGGKKPSV